MASALEVLGPAQQASLLGFLRACADGEISAESMRCRLCEVQDFDPYDNFKSLQGNWNSSKGWISAMDLHTWLGSQPHHLAGTLLEEIASMLTPYVNAHGELRYEGFLRMTLPKDPAHAWLKESALMRGSQTQEGSNRDWSKRADVAYRLCQLFSNEMDLVRHLKFHRKALRELGVHRDMVLKFLDHDQGVCAGMGGLISPTAVRHLLVDQLRALTTQQCDALLRRLNPSGASLAAFEDFAKYLAPPLPPIVPLSKPGTYGEDMLMSDLNTSQRYARSPSPTRGAPLLREPLSSPSRSLVEKHLDGFTTPAPIPRLGNSSFYGTGSPIKSPPNSWKDNKDNFMFDSYSSPKVFDNCYDSTTSFIPAENAHLVQNGNREGESVAELKARVRDLEGQLAKAKGKHSPFSSPDQKFSGLASTQASTADLQQSPRSPWWASSRLSPSLSATAQLRDPGEAGLQPRQQKRASSVPAVNRDGPVLGFSMKSGRHAAWNPDHERLVKAVLEVIAGQAAADARVEDAKSLLNATCLLETVFGHLDRYGKGFVVDTDLWQLTQDFGGQTPFSGLVALIHELQVRSSQNCVKVPGRLSMREIGVLVLPMDSTELQAIKDVATDAEAKNVLYLLRNSEPCPSCGMRVQRSAECAGCPNVTCPVCFTSFRCFCVVSDIGSLGEEQLQVTSQYHTFKLVDQAARAASDLERSRSRLSMQPFYGLAALSDVFNSISNGKVSFRQADLRRALSEQYIFLSESEIGLVWRRYASANGLEVTFPDFARQLKPRLGGYAA